MNPRRLYRCRHDRQLAGVASGMAQYFDLDPTVVRILWIVSVFFGGFTLLLYIVLALVVPLEPETLPAPGAWQAAGPAWGAPSAPGAGPEASVSAAADAAAPGTGSFADGTSSHPGWPAPASDHRHDARRAGRGGFYLGILLVVFGSIALAHAVFPGLASVAWFGPAILLAFGLVLVAGSIRRGSPTS